MASGLLTMNVAFLSEGSVVMRSNALRVEDRSRCKKPSVIGGLRGSCDLHRKVPGLRMGDMYSMHVLRLGSGKSIISRGGNSLDRTSGKVSRATNHDCTNSVGPRSALQNRRGSEQQKGSTTTNDNLNTEKWERKLQEEVIAAAVAMPPSPEVMQRLTTQVKPVDKLARFWAVLERVWKKPHPTHAFMNVIESVLTLLEPNIYPYNANVGIQLRDNFAPVTEECPPTSGLEVTGQIPEGFNGVFLRNGSNPHIMPSGGYHVFDGNGMIHAVRFKDGVASYCCRYVHTYRYKMEKELGYSLFPHALGELNGWPGFGRMAIYFMRGFLRILDISKRFGTANAGLSFYNGKLLALSEDDMPYALSISPEDGDLHNLGRYDICGREEQFAMTAHPKIDPITGEMFAYSYRLLQSPYVYYWRANPQGEMYDSVVTISSIKEPVLLHDFAMTENYVIIPDSVMVFRMQEMVAGNCSVHMDDMKVTKFGLLPKYATDDSEIRWFEAPGSNCIHYWNAWEEGDEVVLLGSSMRVPARLFTDIHLLTTHLMEYRMDLKTGQFTMKRLSDWNIDFGRINERFTGRKNRFVYQSMAGPWPKISGIVKVNIEAASAGAFGEVGVRKFPPHCYISEPSFVPRVWGADDAESEDDGYIVTFLHNEITNVSELGIFDARSPTLEPVAFIKMPVRVPYGFHGLFIPEEQLANQYPFPLTPENLN